jgi:hypothetical protein
MTVSINWLLVYVKVYWSILLITRQTKDTTRLLLDHLVSYRNRNAPYNSASQINYILPVNAIDRKITLENYSKISCGPMHIQYIAFIRADNPLAAAQSSIARKEIEECCG